MADDDKMMKDLEDIADKSEAPAKPGERPAFGPGSGPMRGRRRAGGEALAPVQVAKPKVRDEKVPNPVGTLLFGLVGLGIVLIGLLLTVLHFFQKMGGFFEKSIPDFSYAIVALGFFLIARSRWRSHKTFQVAAWKNRRDAHAWKLPLIWTQGFMLNCLAIYTLGVGINWWPAATNLVLLTFGLSVFLAYLLWYTVASFANHYPSLAGLRIAVLGLFLAIAAYIAWTMVQFVMFSLIFGFYALVAAIASTMVTPFGAPQVRGNWLRILCMIGTVLLLVPVGLNATPFGKPRAILTKLGPAIQGLSGDIDAMVYSQDGTKLALSQYQKGSWYLRVVDAEKESGKVLKVKAGQETFRPVFVQDGSSIILDPVLAKARGLWKVDAESGQITVMTPQGVEPVGEGNPWSEKGGRFLYVTKGEEGYRLNALDPSSGKNEVLLTTFQAILSPSWTREADQIAYVLATKQNTAIYVMDLPSKKQRLLAANDPDMKEEALFGSGGTEPALKPGAVLMLYAVIPSTDGFRYLYLAKKGDRTSLWTIMPDGSKRVRLYQTRGAVEHVAWLNDGHKIFFQERQKRFGFFRTHYIIKVLDADLATVEDLIPPQLSHKAPAVSPDGVKVAFTGQNGLWYPSQDRQSIWVAVLR